MPTHRTVTEVRFTAAETELLKGNIAQATAEIQAQLADAAKYAARDTAIAYLSEMGVDITMEAEMPIETVRMAIGTLGEGESSILLSEEWPDGSSPNDMPVVEPNV